MKRLTKLTLLITSLTLVALFVSIAWAKRTTEQPKGTLLAIEVPMRSGPFTVPAALPGRFVSAHVRVPSVDSTQASPEQVTAVRLMPSMDGDKLRVDVYALYGNLSKIQSCDDWKNLRSSLIGKYVAGSGEEITIKELSDLGVKFGEKPFTVRIVPTKYVITPALLQGGAGCLCGGCGDLTCCPSRGHCLRCGDCGDVCCGLGG